MKYRSRIGYLALTISVVSFSWFVQGCVATRDWVREHVDPLSGRVSQTETRITQNENQIGSLGGRLQGVEGRVGQFEGQLGQFEGKLGQIDAKTEQALRGIANLRLERKLVLDLREGAHFASNSATLPTEARREIDGFLGDLKGDMVGADGVVFLVAGHTDSVGSENYNYELGKRRADSVARYLITQKQMDPLKVVAVSYGQSAPRADNQSREGRAKNRRVEILVYREGIASTAATASPQSNPSTSQLAGERLGQK